MGLRRQYGFDTDLVLPVVCEIIFVNKAFIDPESQILYPDGIRIIAKRYTAYLGNTIAFAMNSELMKMVIRPSHSYLEDVVQISDRAIAVDQQTAPKHWAYAQQQHF